MKRIIDTIIENGGKPKVDFSLFVFLKFIQSVTPTIEYDNTVDLELDWSYEIFTKFNLNLKEQTISSHASEGLNSI